MAVHLKSFPLQHRDLKRNGTEFGETDETFAFLAGYTSSGAPYGLTHKEWEVNPDGS